MGCTDSNRLHTNERKKNCNDAQKNHSKENEPTMKDKNRNDELIKKNVIIKDEEKKENKVNYRNEINLKYFMKSDGFCKLFGEQFVKNNKNNIELKINGVLNELIDGCELKKGENNITLIVKNKLTDLSYFFCASHNLKDFSELNYLDTSDAKNLEYMFFSCKSLSDITPLKKWGVSHAINLKGMFFRCTSLSDITPLKDWNVSNCKIIESMFLLCSSLSDITPLKN